MTSWLGIAFFVLFSLGLTWFMRHEHRAAPPLPPDLGRWQRSGEPVLSSKHDTRVYEERRLWCYEGSLFRKARLVEQRRTRRASDDAIVEVLPERPV